MIIRFKKMCEPIGKEGKGKYFDAHQRIAVDRDIGEEYIRRGLADEVPSLFEEVTIKKKKKV